jgi:hypothetical protein
LKEPEEVRSKIVSGCDVVLVPLLYWQATETLMPATMIATGIVLAVRAAASLPAKRRRG